MDGPIVGMAVSCHEHSTTQSHELSLSDVVLLLAFGSVGDLKFLSAVISNKSYIFYVVSCNSRDGCQHLSIAASVPVLTSRVTSNSVPKSTQTCPERPRSHAEPNGSRIVAHISTYRFARLSAKRCKAASERPALANAPQMPVSNSMALTVAPMVPVPAGTAASKSRAAMGVSGQDSRGR